MLLSKLATLVSKMKTILHKLKYSLTYQTWWYLNLNVFGFLLRDPQRFPLIIKISRISKPFVNWVNRERKLKTSYWEVYHVRKSNSGSGCHFKELFNHKTLVMQWFAYHVCIFTQAFHSALDFWGKFIYIGIIHHLYPHIKSKLIFWISHFFLSFF